MTDMYLDLDDKQEASAPWLYHGMDRARAEDLLYTVGNEGSFLVRSKPGDIEQYALSMTVNGRPIHHLIERSGPVLLVNGRTFGGCSTLPQLIQFLRSPRAELGWRNPIISPITVNNAGDKADEEYHLLWEAQTDDLYIDQDGQATEGPAPASVLGSSEDPYKANARIALGAREGSRRKRFPKLSDEITGKSSERLSPNPRSSAGSLYDTAPPPVIGAPPVVGSPPAASTESSPESKRSSFEDRSKRRSTLSSLLKSFKGKKKNTNVSLGPVELNVRLLGSSTVDGISGLTAAQEGMSKITFVTRTNPDSIQSAEMCVAIDGVVIRTADKAKTILHQVATNELTYAFVDNEEPMMFGIIVQQSTSIHQNGKLIAMIAEDCRGTQCVSVLQDALKAKMLPHKNHGPRSLSANAAADVENTDELYADTAVLDSY
eukprot:m.25087 g.25087  ORF g.25087 m.25087 type:complete len:432 (-) comp7732_c0_seq1:28-1323(-)